MDGKFKLSFHSRVLLMVLALCWLLAGTFMVFQYQREKEFKTALLDARLQAHNLRVIEDMRHGEPPAEIVRRIGSPVKGLRVTVIDSNGSVIYDSNDLTPFPSTNHNSRPEIRDAREHGAGFIVERHSESDDVDYFYSAKAGDDGIVVRSAVPYTNSLQEFLRADRTLLWVLGTMTLVMSLAGFMAARKISFSIVRLNRFAEKAEKGDPVFGDEAFPNDELGSIASHIVRLYIQRDRQHREALRQEQEKIRLKKQLTNNINHELKTPVASILVCLELVRDHPELPVERKEEFIARAITNVRRLDTMLKDVATITRMDEGLEMINMEPVCLNEIVDEVADEARLRTDMDITTDIPPLVINGNRQLIESVFRNLMDNAIAYSGGTEISVTADRKGNFIFRDNGRGIPQEHLPHIFERFYRLDKGRSRAAGGTGLGLAIVRNAVVIHGGSITATDENGLRFDFNLGHVTGERRQTLPFNKKATMD